MRLTTKGRYGMRLVLDIAQHEGNGPVSINEISQRQGVSAKYLERLVGDLRRAGFVRSQRGRDGGHMLALPAEGITVGAIVRALEGDSFLLACCKNRHTCERSGSCLTRAIWIAADQAMYEKLNSVSVRNILDDSRKCLAAREAATAMEAAFVPPQGNVRSRLAGDVCPAPPYSVMPLARNEWAGKSCPASASTPCAPGADSGAAAIAQPVPRTRRMTRRLFLRRAAPVESLTVESGVEQAEQGNPEPVPAHIPAAESAAALATPRGRKVLVVEADENGLAQRLAELRQAGYEACGAADGPSALALLSSAQPDLVLVDLELPDSWGPRLCGELAREGVRMAPVLILSTVPDMHLGLRRAVATISRTAGAQELLRAVDLALAQK